jgi:hypothetical protein
MNGIKQIAVLTLALIASTLLLNCPGRQVMHRPKRGQLFDGSENLLIIAPKSLLGARVKIDGAEVGSLWAVSHIRSSGVDQSYQPPFPPHTPADASATRLHVGPGEHIITVESVRFEPIVRTLASTVPRPTYLVIHDHDLSASPP